MSARRVTIRSRGVSLRLEVRVLCVLAIAGLASLAVFVVGVGRGEFQIAPADVLATLVGAGDHATSFVILELRVPRGLTAALVGMALGLSGAIFQDLARNALVSPDVIGITSGASLAAVAVIVFGVGGGALSVPFAALCGALASAIAIYCLAWRGGLQGYRLVLVGIGITAVLQAGIHYVLTRGEVYEVARATVWLVGSLNGRAWDDVWPLAVTLAALLPIAPILARQLEILQLGDDVASGLGIGVERARLALIAVAVVLAAVAVSAAGPVMFTAFIAPHIARRVCRSLSPCNVLPAAAAMGALLVLGSDLATRLLFSPREIPVGIVTAIVAAPYFLYLLQRANRLGTSG